MTAPITAADLAAVDEAALSLADACAKLGLRGISIRPNGYVELLLPLGRGSVEVEFACARQTGGAPLPSAALARRLGVPARATCTPPSLTPLERRVLLWVADGASNNHDVAHERATKAAVGRLANKGYSTRCFGGGPSLTDAGRAYLAGAASDPTVKR